MTGGEEIRCGLASYSIALLIGGPHDGEALDLPDWLATNTLTYNGVVYDFDHAHPGGERFYVYNAPPDQMEDR